MTDSRNAALATPATQRSSIYSDLTSQVAASIRNKYETTELNAPKPTNPTLLEFPGNWKNEPEWKRKIREKVRAVQDKRSGNDSSAVFDTQTGEVKTPSYSAPRLVFDIAKEPAPANAKQQELLDRALLRIESSRRKHSEDYQEMLRVEKIRRERAQAAAAEKSAPPVTRDNVRTIPPERLQNRPNSENPIHNSLNPNSIHNSFAPNSAKAEIAQSLRPSMPLKDSDFIFKPLAIVPEPVSAKAETISENIGESAMEISEIQPLLLKTNTLEANIKPTDKPSESEARGTPSKQVKFNGQSDVAYLDELIVKDENYGDDFAPIGLRSVAGLIDAAAVFLLTFVLFAPFGILQIFSLVGVMAFAGVFAVIMFLYYSTVLHLFGSTLGARMFSLYSIDADTGELPTLEQSTKSAAAYLASLATFGVPLLTVFLSPEKRALHDLFSGTIVVKEIE